MNLIESLVVITENCINHRQLQSSPTCQTPGMGGVNLSTTQYHICYANHGSRNNTFIKAMYRSLVVRRLTSILEKKASIPVISILSAKMWLSKAWNTLPDKILIL